MRADRLVATLLFLQTRGRVTAAQVAAELEVSTRTARRDLEALALAGIPVYSRPGRSGGWSLVGGARTDLTGLTATEARTLFLVAGPSLVVTPEAKAALRKLIQALPETFRAEAEQAASAIVLDPTEWGSNAREPLPHLETLQHAIVTRVQVKVGYRDRQGNITKRTVNPLGLVSKQRAWYLIAGTATGQRTFLLWRIESAQLTDQPAVRPPGFDLKHEWETIEANIAELRGEQTVSALAEPRAVAWMHARFGESRVAVRSDTTDDDRLHVEITFPTTHTPVAELAGLAAVLEVLEPANLRTELHDLGQQLVAQYKP
ncbi:MAG: putative DNA-binding transcriptional regulator YafY [Candidatus Aldehydirespiratoraceae bacterium]|jgi:predicted DNA-binding transcriptional regulator YafY